MQTSTTQASTQKKGGKLTARFGYAVLAACMTLSMGLSVSASIGSAGASVQPSPHLDTTAHNTDGTAFYKEASEEKNPTQVPSAPIYGGTIYVREGETATVHILQRGVTLFGVDGFRTPWWYMPGDKDHNKYVGLSTNLDGLKKDEIIPHLKAYKAKNDHSGGSTAHCMELYIQGKKAGTVYFGYYDGSGLEARYYKVVVLPKDTKDEDIPSNNKGTSGSQGSGSTGGGFKPGSSSNNSAANGGIKDDPNNPQSVLPHLIVPR